MKKKLLIKRQKKVIEINYLKIILSIEGIKILKVVLKSLYSLEIKTKYSSI
jgi:hypothetical protein